MRRAAGDPWSAQMDEQLAALWAEGISTRLIGEQLGVTKNAVVDRSRRLGLPVRPNPVGAARARRVEQRRPRTLPAPPAPPREAAWTSRAVPELRREEPGRKPLPSFLPPPARACRWIEGDPRAPGGPRWCAEPSAGTTTLTACYCARHAARVISRGPQDRVAA